MNLEQVRRRAASVRRQVAVGVTEVIDVSRAIRVVVGVFRRPGDRS